MSAARTEPQRLSVERLEEIVARTLTMRSVALLRSDVPALVAEVRSSWADATELAMALRELVGQNWNDAITVGYTHAQATLAKFDERTRARADSVPTETE